MKLTPKQQAFVTNKAAGVSNRDAAMAAGYSMASADVRAAELMRRPDIKAAIKAANKGQGVDMKPADKPAMPKERYTDPMTFLVDVMNHADLPIAMRADAAKQLLPYQHARMGETGKKEKAKDRAREIARGTGKHKFTPMRPPQLRVVPKE